MLTQGFKVSCTSNTSSHGKCRTPYFLDRRILFKFMICRRGYGSRILLLFCATFVIFDIISFLPYLSTSALSQSELFIMAQGLSRADLESSIAKYAPILKLNPNEIYKNCSVEWYLKYSTLIDSTNAANDIVHPTEDQLPQGPKDGTRYSLQVDDAAKPGDFSTVCSNHLFLTIEKLYTLLSSTGQGICKRPLEIRNYLHRPPILVLLGFQRAGNRSIRES